MARKLMDLARTHFQVRTCQIEIDGRLSRPCLYYHMRACLGPCVDGLTTPEDYAEVVEELRLFLAGRRRQLVDEDGVGAIADIARSSLHHRLRQAR